MKTWILVLLVGVVGVSQAQVLEDLTFSEKVHDFGRVEETGGAAEHTFTFKNTSGTPVRILGVKASCGCTTPGWTTEEVPAGGEGFVKASYNPMNRPGPFNKSLTVTTSTQKTYILFIKGDVNPKPRTIEDDYPMEIGGIRSKYRGFNMGKLLNNAPVTRSYEIYNQTDAPIEFLDSLSGPSYIEARVEPGTVPAHSTAMIVVTFDPAMKNDLGFMSDNIVLYTNEAEDEAKSFSVYTNIEEYFPPMTAEELAAAPKLKIADPLHDFGRIKEGENVSTTFVIANEGKQPLNIRKTSSTCGCTVSKPSKETLEAGETAEVEVTFNSTGRRGNQQKSITLFSNDPQAPTQRLTIKAFVEE